MKTARLTANQQGSMFPLAKYTRHFLRYVQAHPGKVLDIGAAYGITTLPALACGAEVTAMDISEAQLAILRKSARPRKNLCCIAGHFPEQFPVGLKQYYDVVLASHVLHFLGPRAFRQALKKIYTLLQSGGKVFVQCFTPYHRFMEKFIPVYEQHLKSDALWPGLTRHSSRYVLEKGILPELVNLMTPDILAREFRKAGFIIEHCEYTPCPKSLGKKWFVLDGREWVGLIAHKS